MEHKEIAKIGVEMAHREHFTVPEWLEREKYVKTILEFDVMRVVAAKSLMALGEKNLYRPYRSLTEFCQRTFGWSPRRAEQMIASAKLIANRVVLNERQARELRDVPEDKQPQVVDEAVRFHSKDGKLTAKAIHAAKKAEKVYEGPEDDLGLEIPPAALPYWNRRHEIQDMMNHASALRVAMGNIAETDPLYHGLWPIGNMKRELDEIYNKLRGILPSYVCGYCEGKNDVEECAGCKGTGLLSVYFDKMLPQEKRANARTRP